MSNVVIITDSYHNTLLFKKMRTYAPKSVNLHIIEVPLRYPYTLLDKLTKCFFKTIKKLETIKKADIVISISTLCSLTPLLFKKLNTKMPQHILIDIGLPRIFKHTIPQPLRSLLAETDLIVCFARSQTLYWQKVYGYSNTRFIPFGIDVESYTANYTYYPYIFSGGRSDRDYATLIKALYMLRSKLKSIKIYIAYGKDTITFKNPLLIIPQQNSQLHVRLFYELPHKLYIKLLSKAMLMILPLRSAYYATGHTSLLEAMALGKAVIVSNIPSVMDYVVNWKTGVLFKPGDHLDLKDKIEYLLENQGYIVKLGMRAREAVEQYFNLKAMTIELMKLISKV